MQKVLILLFHLSTYFLIKVKWPAARKLRFNGPFIDIFGEGDLECGVNSYLSHFTRIYIERGTRLRIGDNVSIGHNVRIYTSKVDAIALLRTGKKTTIKSDVSIGDNVLISANVYIGPGTEICDNVFIGANSVVSKSISVPGIYSGIPAKLIREIS